MSWEDKIRNGDKDVTIYCDDILITSNNSSYYGDRKKIKVTIKNISILDVLDKLIKIYDPITVVEAILEKDYNPLEFRDRNHKEKENKNTDQLTLL